MQDSERVFRILVVDDEETLARLIHKRLGSQGFLVDYELSGNSAYKCIKANQYDLVLLDYMLGDMFATELIEMLNNDQLDVPFIIMTARGSEKIAVETMKLGAIDYIIKDFTLLEVLPKYLKQQLGKIQLEKAFKQREQHLIEEKINLLENIPDMVFQLDDRGRLSNMNSAVKKILGYEALWMQGQKLEQFVHPDDKTALKHDYESAKKGQGMLKHTLRFIHKDGNVCWLEGKIVFGLAGHDGDKEVCAIYKDVTNEKKIYDDLIETEHRLRMVIDSSPNLIIKTDMELNLINYNLAAQNYFGLGNVGSADTKHFLDLFLCDFQNEIIESIERARAGQTVKLTSKLKGGENQNWFDLIIKPMKDIHGRIVSILITAWDVSDRVANEDRISNSLQAKARLAKESDILRMIALSAGTGESISSEAVVDCVVNEVTKYIGTQTTIGCLFQKGNHLVTFNSQSSDDVRASVDSFLENGLIENVLRHIRSPRMISKMPFVGISRSELIDDIFPPDKSIFVPFVNEGVSYGFMITVLNGRAATRHVFEFLRLLSKSAGLAIANAEMFESASTSLKNRMSLLKDFHTIKESVLAQERIEDALRKALEAGLNFVRARTGLAFLYDKQSSIMKLIAGVNIPDKVLRCRDAFSCDSLLLESMKNQKTLYLADITDSKMAHPNGLENFCEHSIVCVPMVDTDECVGVFVLIDPMIELEENYLSVLDSFATLAVESMSKVVLEQKATELDHKLEELRKISRTIITGATLESILSKVCESTVDAMGAELALIGVYDKANESLKCLSYVSKIEQDLEKENLEKALSNPGGQALEAIKQSKTLIYNRLEDLADLSHLKEDWGFNSCCVMPISNKADCYGVMVIYHSATDIFNSKNVALLEEFGDRAAISISNLKLRQTLIESESMRDRIMDSVNDAVLAIDHNGFVFDANQAAEKLLKKNVSDFFHKPYFELFGSNNPISNLIESWFVTCSDVDSQDGIFEIDSEELYIAVDASSVIINDQPCLLLTIKDLTEQKKMNASLEHTAKLSTVGRIATQIAHEIGNPLTLLSSQIQRISDSEEDIKPDKLKKLLPHIDRISGLIRRLSDLGRKSPINRNPEFVQSIIDNILSLVECTKPFEKVVLKKEIAPSLPMVNVDKNKITQVILNLLLNAADACEDGGEVCIRVYKKMVEVTRNNNKRYEEFVIISVEDDGLGIPEELQKKIFEPFFTTKAPGKGTGLGLSVSLSIIDQHHGWIDLKSEPDSGTVFTIYLPAITAAQLDRSDLKKIKTVAKAADFEL